MAFKEAFTDSFGIVCTKDASFVALLDLGALWWFYSIERSIAKAAHKWEVDVFTSFFKVLYLARVRQEGKDKLW